MTQLRLSALLLSCLLSASLFAQVPQPAVPQPVPQPATAQPVAQPALPQPVPQPTAPAAQPVPGQPATPPAPVAVDPNAIAATVNGAPIHELAVQRGLEGVPPAKRAEARPEILNFLIDNLLIDQYLTRSNIQVTAQEVEGRLTEMKTELTRRKVELAEMLKQLKLTEAELRTHVAAEVRWERFVTSQATDAALKQMFEGNKEMFDETTMRARHILLTPASGDARACEAAVAALRACKQQVEAAGAEALKKVPADADALTRERARMKAMEEAFVAAAKDKSACPSKERGGDLGWFQRVGFMVEPFARAAFVLKPFEMSDAVKSPYGYHLILAMDRKPGKEVTFDQVKERVRDTYGERLREHLVSQLRPKAQIAIAPAK